MVAEAEQTWQKRVDERNELLATAALIESEHFSEREAAREAQKKLDLDIRPPQKTAMMPEQDYEIISEKQVKHAYLEELLEVRNRKRAARLREDLSDLNEDMEPGRKLFLR